MISIIIPAHNEKKNLYLLLDQLSNLKNTTDYEILVAMSPSCHIPSKNPAPNKRIKFIKCKKKGRAAQMNEASRQANGAIFAFLHADIQPPPTFMADIQKAIEQGFDAGFFSYRFDTENLFLKINASFTGRNGIFTGGGDQCLFIRKQVFQKLGRFDDAQVLMEDFEFFGRMKKNKVPYTIVKNELIVSARKYESNSYLRVNLSNLLLITLFKMGCPANKLKSLHDLLIRTNHHE